MADEPIKLPEQHYHIASKSDLQIRALPEEPMPSKNTSRGVHDDKVPDVQPTPATVFHVQKAVLVKIDYFRILLQGGFRESGQKSVTLRGDDVHALDIWFRLLHHDGLDEITYNNATIATAWEVIATGKKYDLPTSYARDWFMAWHYHHRNALAEGSPLVVNNRLRMLLMPAHVFDEHYIFMNTTRSLAYDVEGHITEARPDNVRRDLHIPSSLYSAISRLLKANCNHKEAMLFAYERKLARSGAWPLEEIGHRSSISGLLKMLEKVDVKDMPEGRQQCNIAVESVIRGANSRVKDYFKGLCLGCINQSKLRDHDDDYWNHASIQRWDHGCQIEHGQPTWHFSFMGRREVMTKWLQRNKLHRGH